MILSLLSLLGIGCYAYALCVLLLIRQETPLLCAALCGCLTFGLCAWFCLKRGHRVLSALHAFVSATACVLCIALLLI
ncbi:MAG: hypothetical protein K6G15_11940 [Desulfovibrio sp.]|nr:hypothetical protein [Desulfovibrio sp.]